MSTQKWIINAYKKGAKGRDSNGCRICGWNPNKAIHSLGDRETPGKITYHKYIQPKT